MEYFHLNFAFRSIHSEFRTAMVCEIFKWKSKLKLISHDFHTTNLNFTDNLHNLILNQWELQMGPHRILISYAKLKIKLTTK